MRQRSTRRIPLELPVSIAGRTAAVSVDLSPTGMAVTTESLLVPGERVSGHLWFGGKRLAWSGTVTWSRPGNPMAQAWHRAGIHLRHMSPGLRALVSLRSRAAHSVVCR